MATVREVNEAGMSSHSIRQRAGYIQAHGEFQQAAVSSKGQVFTAESKQSWQFKVN